MLMSSITAASVSLGIFLALSNCQRSFCYELKNVENNNLFLIGRQKLKDSKMKQSNKFSEQEDRTIKFEVDRNLRPSLMASDSITGGDSSQSLTQMLSSNDPIIKKLTNAARYAAIKNGRPIVSFTERSSLDRTLFIRFFMENIALDWALSRRRLANYPQGVSGEKIDRVILSYYQEMQSGFVRQMEARFSISEKIDKIVFTGFFVSGALAVLFALDMKNDLIRKKVASMYEIEVVTFGTPRFGNFQFAQYVNSKLQGPSSTVGLVIDKVFRVTHGDDIFSQEPWNTIGKTGYFHHEREYWINPVNSCDCITKKETNEAHQIFRCFGAFNADEEYFEEPQECNRRASLASPRIYKSIRNYFGNWL